jgi:hypothetical protein
MDLLINDEIDDIEISGGDLSLTSDQDAIRQALSLQLRMVRGEWFLDNTLGTDYYGQIFGFKNFIQADAEFIRSILSVPGVVSILEPLAYNLDKVNRVLSVSFKVQTDTGVIEQTETISVPA